MVGTTTKMLNSSELSRLIFKYQEMLRLRRLHEQQANLDPRKDMLTLASEFPGALREIDELPMDEIARRIDALRTAIADGPIEDWMVVTARYHAMTRGALCAKCWLKGRKVIDGAITAEFAKTCGTFAFGEDAKEWEMELAAIANPPRGRVTDIVFRKLATSLGRTEDEIRALLFPYSRKR